MLAARELVERAEPHRISRLLPGLRYVSHGFGCARGPIGPIAGPAKWDSLRRCCAWPLPSVPTGIIENIKRGREAVSASFRAIGVCRFQRGQQGQRAQKRKRQMCQCVVTGH